MLHNWLNLQMQNHGQVLPAKCQLLGSISTLAGSAFLSPELFKGHQNLITCLLNKQAQEWIPKAWICTCRKVVLPRLYG